VLEFGRHTPEMLVLIVIAKDESCFGNQQENRATIPKTRNHIPTKVKKE
jgi:hypothetical protein